MFPKPRGTHRGTEGSFNLGFTSAGQVYESYTGKLYANPTLFYNSTDIDDVVNYELFNNPTWSASSLATIQNTTYYQGANYRFRLTNAYFGTTGSYVTGTASTQTRVGGASSQIITANSITENTSGSYDATRKYYFRVNVPKELVNSLNIYDREVLVGMSFFYSGSVINEFVIFSSWPEDTVGSTVSGSGWTIETVAASGGGSHYVAEVRWAALGPPSVWYSITCNYTIKYIDSGANYSNYTNFNFQRIY